MKNTSQQNSKYPWQPNLKKLSKLAKKIELLTKQERAESSNYEAGQLEERART